MSMLQLNIGQAGGQIGSVVASYTGPYSNDGHGCLFIDSEPKVRIYIVIRLATATLDLSRRFTERPAP